MASSEYPVTEANDESPTESRPAGVSRRRLMQAGGAVTISAATLGLGRTRAAATPRSGSPGKIIFDPAKPGTAFLTNAYLSMVRTAMQSFVIDTVAGHIYVLQLVEAGTSLPGDEDGDETYERRSVRGDLALTKLDLDGTRLGRMYLKFFGHGVSMGLERDGRDIWLWTEIDSVPKESDGQGRGCRLTRFQFADGEVLDAEHDDSLWRRELIPGSTQNTCSIDPVNDRLAMRYWDGEAFRIALYDLAQVKLDRSSYQPLYDIATPAEVSTNLFQGYATLGDDLYHVDGEAYSDSNPGPPPAGKGNAHLARISWKTGKIDKLADETTGLQQYRREPEALSVVADYGRQGRPTRLRLFSGFATSAHESPSADRLCSLYFREPR